MSTGPTNQIGYGLTNPTYHVFPSPIVSKTRGPTTSDQAEIGSVWIFSTGVTSQAWVLGAVVANIATWIPIGNGMGLIAKANDGTTATPAANILNIFGNNPDGLTTTASGNTLIVEALALQKPAFLAYQPATTNNVTGSGTTYVLGTAVTNGGFNVIMDTTGGLSGTGGAATLTYTVPRTGAWILTLAVSYNSGSAYAPLFIRITTTSASFIDDTSNATNISGGAGSDNMSVVTLLTAGDTITYSCAVSTQGADSTAILGSVLPFTTFVSGALIS